jgi:hypothetical protein
LHGAKAGGKAFKTLRRYEPRRVVAGMRKPITVALSTLYESRAQLKDKRRIISDGGRQCGF